MFATSWPPWRFFTLIAVCAIGVTAGCEQSPSSPARSRPESIRAISFVDATADGYASPAAAASLDALAATGANGVVIVITAYQADAASSTVRADDPRTPTTGAVSVAVTRAHNLGLEVAIKPHVDVDDGTWRARIAPSSPGAWFDSYRAFLLSWASFAQSQGAARFVVGTELAGTIEHTEEWRETIRRVREVFHGELVYAASWDEAGRVPFWRDLDYVGVDFFFPVAQRNNPGRLEILAAWQPWLDRLHRLHRQAGRPVLLTEVGYRSVDGAGMRPWDYTTTAPVDPGEQADLYWAALEATAGEAWIAGLNWWNWPADDTGGPGDDHYTPRGKPAQDELVAAWRP